MGSWTGSVRMGADPTTSAVDSQLRLRGVDGVRVAGEFTQHALLLVMLF
jgi:hypothetical protein